jgi:hypothetical protein
VEKLGRIGLLPEGVFVGEIDGPRFEFDDHA